VANDVLLAGDCCKEEDVLRNESQDAATQIYRHLQQTDGGQGPPYSAVRGSCPSIVLCLERGIIISGSNEHVPVASI